MIQRCQRGFEAGKTLDSLIWRDENCLHMNCKYRIDGHTHTYSWLIGLQTRSCGSWFGNLQSLISLLKDVFSKHCIGLRTALFWFITQQVVLIPYWRFGTTFHTDCLEKSERNYRCLLHNNPEEHNSHLLRGGSLKSRIEFFLYFWTLRPKIEWFWMWYIIIRNL